MSGGSPLPRSHSDFGYVGLNCNREKRFSLLLPPPFSSPSGYSRLAETPVTLQPRGPSFGGDTTKPKSPTDAKKPQPKPFPKSPSLDHKCNGAHKPFPRSPTFDPRLSKPISRSPTYEFRISKPISKSPTFEPRLSKQISRSPTFEPRISKPISRSPTFDPRLSKTIHHSPTPLSKTHGIQRSRSPTSEPQQSHSPSLETRWTPRAVRKSPTLDSTLRYSPLLNHGGAIGRSPTLDPSVLMHRKGEEVVRSQSLRSLGRSPLKMRGSESAQSDVTCPIHRPFPLSEEDDLLRLRNFSVTSKGGLINWGDSFRSQSLTSMADARWPPGMATSASEQWTSATCSKKPFRFKVAIMGVDEVGKTSIIRQFQTSEYICAFDTSYDINKDYAITVILNKEESELEFIEYRLPDEEEAEVSDEELPSADAHVVVYSVTSRRSFARALDLLARLRRLFRRSALVLVGNKSDLVRVRAVTSDEGESSAGEHVVFVETSTAINHQVDELLVAILSRIRAKSRASEAPRPSLARAIKRFLKKACFHAKSASADNLQRL